MADPIERKRLKKKMLDRWENEGGRLATDIASADATRPPSEEGGAGKLSSSSENSTVAAPASSNKRRKPTPK